jgi:hypothetical protein
MRANHAVSLRSISAILYDIHGYQIKHFSNQDVEECAQCGSASRSGSEQSRRGSRTIAQRRGRAPLLYVRSNQGSSRPERIRLGEPMENDVSSKIMSQIYRIKVPARDRSGSSEGLPRFVVMVEIPDPIISEFENPGSPELQLKALGTAMNATWNQRVRYRNFQFSSWSSSELVDANPADYGAASLRAGDGCSAWIVESPLAARHAGLTVH